MLFSQQSEGLWFGWGVIWLVKDIKKDYSHGGFEE